MRNKNQKRIVLRTIDPKMNMEFQQIPNKPPKISIKMTEVKENVDFYIENGYFVFTEKYLKERGYCCENGCRHCPFKS